MTRCLRIALPFLFLLSSISILRAQNEANVWHFGTFAGIDFNSGSPVAIGGSAMDQDEGCASIADRTTGMLLFYTDGVTIWNQLHVPMANGTGLLGDTSSTQSAMIMPMPGDSTRYYVFTSDAGPYQPRRAGINYSIVDMTLAGGLGQVIVKNQRVFAPAVEKLVGVRHCNGIDYWVISHEWGSNRFRAYLVTAKGVSTTPVISAVGTAHTGSSSNSIGYLKASPNGRRLAASLLGDDVMDLFDFDNQTGVVSNHIPISPITGSYGLSFSPDNSKLYVVSGNFPLIPASDTLLQFDLSSGSPAAIRASRVPIHATTNGFLGSMQIGPDGKIYVARYGPEIGIINSPNVAGISCNYVHNGLDLSPGLCTDGLPNFIDGIFDESPPELPCEPPRAKFGPRDTVICVGTCLIFSDSSTGGATGWRWDFEGGTPGTSTDRNPVTICYETVGEFSVRQIVLRVFNTDTLRDTAYGRVTVVPPPDADAGRDTVICLGDSVQLHGSGGVEYAWSPQVGLSCSDCADPIASPTTTTTYHVWTANEHGCWAVDSVTVTVSRLSGVDAGESKTICPGDSVKLSATGGASYEWRPAEGLSCSDCADPVARPGVTTVYTVIVRNESGCSGGDSVTVTVAPRPIALVTRDTAVCLGDSVLLKAEGGVTYRWSPSVGLSCTDCAEPIARPTTTTLYRVIVANAEGCLDTGSVTVTVASLPVATIAPVGDLCLGDSVRLIAGGGGTYEWEPSEDLSCLDCFDPVATPTTTTTYRVKVSLGSGCWDTASVTVTVNPVPVAAVGADQEICAGDTVALEASGGDLYEWSPSAGLSCTDCPEPRAYPDATTRYRVVVSSLKGCSDTGWVTVVVHPTPVASAGDDVEICEGGSAGLSASGGVAYRWSPSAGLSCADCPDPIATPGSTTEYRVEVTSADGCVAEDRVTVNVRKPIPVQAHISRTLVSLIGALYRFPVVLDQPLDGEGVTEFSFLLNYDPTVMQLTADTPQRLASMVHGTILEGWTVSLEEFTPGTLRVRVAAPPGQTLLDTGALLNIECRMFVGEVPGTDLPFEISLANGPCAYVVTSPGYIRVDSVCGLNLRLIQLSDATYALEQNVPNPFNPTTEIRFSLGLDGPTRLVIHDALGRAVATLVDGYLQPGEYSVVWDASDQPSGLYYYRLVSGDWSATGRMMLVK